LTEIRLEFPVPLYKPDGDVVDLIYLTLGLGFFALTALLVSAFEHIRRP